MNKKQAIFDRVVKHLVAQGGPARNNLGHCVYRNEQGQKCAIGCLIPDYLYQSETVFDYNGGLATLRDGRVGRYLRRISGGDWQFLRELQGAHDGALVFTMDGKRKWAGKNIYTGSDIVSRLVEIAMKYRLAFNPSVFNGVTI